MWFALRNHPMALLMPQSGRRPQHHKQTCAAHKRHVRFTPESYLSGGPHRTATGYKNQITPDPYTAVMQINGSAVLIRLGPAGRGWAP